MDAFPGYTYFNPTRKVLCAMQIVRDTEAVSTSAFDTVFPHTESEKIDESDDDSSMTGLDNTVELAPTDDAGYDKTLEELVSDVKVVWEGTTATVTGKATKITSWTELPDSDAGGGNPGDDGYFYAIKLDDKYLDKPLEFYRGTDIAGLTQISTTSAAKADDLFWVLKINENKAFQFRTNGVIIATYNLSGITTEE